MAEPAPNLAVALDQWLPDGASALLRQAGRLLAAHGVPAYMVGGGVRDALLGLPFRGEADVTVEGDGVVAARLLAGELGGSVTAHSQFGTAAVHFPCLSLDVVTARSETYPHPGALPVTTPSTLDDDLRRRDFTINAMALSLAPDSWGTLYDSAGGRADLDTHKVRVLHAASFRDDPTRMVRATRYTVRLGFSLAPETAALLAQHAAELGTLTGPRRWHEFERCLQEARPLPCLHALQHHGLLQAIHPALAYGTATRSRLARVAAARYREPLPATALLCLLAWDADTPALNGLVEALQLPRGYSLPLAALPALRDRLNTLSAGQATAASVCRMCDGAPAALLEAATYGPAHPYTRGLVHMYTALWRYVRPILRGDDLVRLGVPFGPQVGRYLAALRLARLAEVAGSVDEERWLAQEWLTHGGPPET